MDIKVVGISGSVGKTSTKEMIASVLEQKYKPLPISFELDNVTTTVWLLKGAFVEQSVVKKILQYLETEGK